MEALVNVAFPIFAIMAIGFWAGRRGLLNHASTSALNRYVFLFALPAAMFAFTARAKITDILNWPYIGAYMLGSLATILVALAAAHWVFRLGREEVAMHGGLATYGNTGYMGIPVFLTAFGPSGLLPAVITNLIGPMLLMAMIMLSLEVMRRPGVPVLRRLQAIALVFARNPVIVASLAGIGFALFRIPLPTPLGNMLDLLASSAGPTALFALGLSLVGSSILGDLAEICWQTFLKLVVQPLLVWLCVTQLFTVDPFWAQSAIILAALPTGSSVFVVAEQYGVAVRRTSAIVALTTVVSVMTLSVLFVVLGVK
jgi:malonate transporter